MREILDERSDAEKAAHDGKNYLVTLSYNCEADSPAHAAELFSQWLDESGTYPVHVTVNPLPFPDGGWVEVPL